MSFIIQSERRDKTRAGNRWEGKKKSKFWEEIISMRDQKCNPDPPFLSRRDISP